MTEYHLNDRTVHVDERGYADWTCAHCGALQSGAMDVESGTSLHCKACGKHSIVAVMTPVQYRLWAHEEAIRADDQHFGGHQGWKPTGGVVVCAGDVNWCSVPANFNVSTAPAPGPWVCDSRARECVDEGAEGRYRKALDEILRIEHEWRRADWVDDWGPLADEIFQIAREARGEEKEAEGE